MGRKRGYLGYWIGFWLVGRGWLGVTADEINTHRWEQAQRVVERIAQEVEQTLKREGQSASSGREEPSSGNVASRAWALAHDLSFLSEAFRRDFLFRHKPRAVLQRSASVYPLPDARSSRFAVAAKGAQAAILQERGE